MKLIFCPTCEDVVRLQEFIRTCQCGRSGGRYLSDGVHAQYWGKAVPLGFENADFTDAVRNQPKVGKQGLRFTAFVIPKRCDTFERINAVEATGV